LATTPSRIHAQALLLCSERVGRNLWAHEPPNCNRVCSSKIVAWPAVAHICWHMDAALHCLLCLRAALARLIWCWGCVGGHPYAGCHCSTQAGACNGAAATAGSP
jgi:hypothetical protein